jgi:MerR family mercuric resistance operon transcriptional regulator
MKSPPAEPRRALRIGELAAASGMTPDGLRYYERKGLLSRPVRTDGGFRVYDASILDRLRFIKHAQAHGLTLREIRDLVSASDRAEPGRCRRVRDRVSRRLAGLDVKRRELELFCTTQREHLATCERALARSEDAECPVVADLGRPAQRKRTG